MRTSAGHGRGEHRGDAAARPVVYNVADRGCRIGHVGGSALLPHRHHQNPAAERPRLLESRRLHRRVSRHGQRRGRQRAGRIDLFRDVRVAQVVPLAHLLPRPSQGRQGDVAVRAHDLGIDRRGCGVPRACPHRGGQVAAADRCVWAHFVTDCVPASGRGRGRRGALPRLWRHHSSRGASRAHPDSVYVHPVPLVRVPQAQSRRPHQRADLVAGGSDGQCCG